jgi:N6-adenosine-specific RNA methylase IME4
VKARSADGEHEFSMVRYRTIVADPPWEYPEGFARNKGGRYADGTSGTEVVSLPYRSMSVAEIAALPIRGMASPDAWLWLWTTNRYVQHAFEVAHLWGFTYKQLIVWHKSDGHPRFPSTIAPNRSEYLLVCKRGHPKRLGVLDSTVISVPFNPARMRHSEKPEVFLDHIERICPGPYLELFARRNRLGWDTWGNESLEHVEMAT